MGFDSDMLSSKCVGALEAINSVPYRPGLQLEKEYWRWLDSCQDDEHEVYVNGIHEWSWVSLFDNLATIDFRVHTANFPDMFFRRRSFSTDAPCHRNFKNCVRKSKEHTEICWESNGSMSSSILEKAAALPSRAEGLSSSILRHGMRISTSLYAVFQTSRL